MPCAAKPAGFKSRLRSPKLSFYLNSGETGALMAQAEAAVYLLKWLNTLWPGEEDIQRLEDLSDGKALLQSMQNVFPDLHHGPDSTVGLEPWTAIWKVLEDFCGCSLEKSVSLEQLQEGDNEQLARVLVLLLCAALCQEQNEEVLKEVVGKLRSLENKVQRCIAFFIENTLSQVNGHAIATGRFTSGVGEVIRHVGDVEEEGPRRPSPLAPRKRDMHPSLALNQDLCTKTALCGELEDRCLRAEARLKQLQVIPDLEDELHHCRQDLEKAQHFQERMKAQVIELREQLHLREKQCKSLERAVASLEQRVEQLTSTVHSTAVKEQKAATRIRKPNGSEGAEGSCQDSETY